MTPFAAQRTAGQPARAGSRRGRRPSRNHGWGWAYLMIAPTTIGLSVFYLWPIAQTLYYSFTSSGPFGGHTWTGLANYQALGGDPSVGQSVLNTLLYTGIQLAAIPFALLVAALLNQPGLRGRSVYRVIFFLPVVTMPVAVAMLWRWMYQGDYGLVNYLLSLVGIHGPHWASDPDYALYSVAAIGIWMSFGYNLVIFLAGLQGIPAEYYEAARVDGAGPVRTFLRITVPLVSPNIFFVTVLTVINSLQMFDIAYMMMSTPGSAAGTANPALPRVRSISYLFFEKAFVEHDTGFGAAVAFVLVAFVVLVTVIQFRLQKRWVHYA
ncbi:carbohydrate ABC transporter permease [Kitasatospora viridis]|uniref:Carbohydrate ABC transporter membrane protein 1 (CUT1 family) n=1 Tax=Kitasatospora viridis TaxID=281105 RepID=A0A561TSH2_9ACTN|nr:sugar ABC transporter permease [Kitasatospora viridis]TWF90062.1 carbohydrate ABC transporter membrane protein 1 (CUT1 family) [Kitasatospora viridis]